MKKSHVPFSIVLLFLVIILSLSISAQQSTSFGPNYERSCQNRICQTTIYYYEKYFYKNNQWEEIDENWHSCGNNFCTKNYYSNITADNNGFITTFSNNQNKWEGKNAAELRGIKPI